MISSIECHLRDAKYLLFPAAAQMAWSQVEEMGKGRRKKKKDERGKGRRGRERDYGATSVNNYYS
jgi:hypothetical protein